MLLLVVGWGWHVQNLNEKRREVETELKGLRSAQKRLTLTLESRGRRLDTLLSAVNEVVMRVDRLGRVMAANPAANRIFDMGSAPELPQSMLLFYREPDWQRAYAQALKKLPAASSLPDMHVAGRVLAPRLAPLGRKQALLLCMDVTESHRIEAQRKTLFANLMHDLKTPLTSILGYARSIEAFGDDEAIRKEAVDVIASESVRANEFLDALLTLEHMDSFSPDDSARCQFDSVLETVLSGFASQFEEKDVRVELGGDRAPSKLKIAEGDLHRILDNLVENALRYTPKQSAIMLNGSVEGGFYLFEITDQGDGVPEKELPRLTERFYRGDKARSKTSDVGHGLGLAIVKELLEKYGGSLELANHDIHGLIATIRLPLASE